jgi:predicted nucleic acid-binding protein
VILVDTSVWIDHLHRSEPKLVEALAADEVVSHTLVIQELALGSIKDRDALLDALVRLHALPVLTQPEILAMVNAHRLWGRGLSAVDAHLLGALLLSPRTLLWSRDKRLVSAAAEFDVPVVGWR